MKLQPPVTSVVPAALAAASVSLSLVLLPGGGASVRSSGVAPALKLVAGEVVAAVKRPAHVVAKAPRKSVVAPATGGGATPAPTQPSSTSQRSSSAPAHRVAHRRQVSRTPAGTSAPVTTQTAPGPQPVSTSVEHGNGKAKALGHAKKAAPPQTGKGHGRPADVPHGPPALPPGHEKNGDAPGEHGNPHGGGGGK
jgi:hypothetical protein